MFPCRTLRLEEHLGPLRGAQNLVKKNTRSVRREMPPLVKVTHPALREIHLVPGLVSDSEEVTAPVEGGQVDPGQPICPVTLLSSEPQVPPQLVSLEPAAKLVSTRTEWQANRLHVPLSSALAGSAGGVRAAPGRSRESCCFCLW